MSNSNLVCFTILCKVLVARGCEQLVERADYGQGLWDSGMQTCAAN